MFLNTVKDALLYGTLLLSPVAVYVIWRLGRSVGEGLMRYIVRRWSV